MEKFAKMVVTWILSSGAILVKGFVLFKLWGWFVYQNLLPTNLTLQTAIGICVILGLFRIKIDKTHNTEIRNDTWLGGVIAPPVALSIAYLLILVVGYLVKHFL
jgi:hypothetical protein